MPKNPKKKKLDSTLDKQDNSAKGREEKENSGFIPSNPLDSSGEYKGGTNTGSTEDRLNRDKSQDEKEQIQEGGSDRK